MVFKKSLKKANSRIKNFKQKGPFGTFLSKIKHSKDIKTQERLAELYGDAQKIQKDWFMFTKTNTSESVKNDPEEKQSELQQLATVDENDRTIQRYEKNICSSILDYFIFRQLPNEIKQKYIDLYHKRYDIEMPDGFSKDYIRITGPTKIHRNPFILWMNYYIRTNCSIEILEYNTYDLALKMGDIWNSLSIEEKNIWNYLIKKDMYQIRKKEHRKKTQLDF